MKELKNIEMGKVKAMSLKLSEPLSIDLDKMELNKLMVFTGLNNSGKTLVLIFNWLNNTLANTVSLIMNSKVPLDSVKMSQDVLNKTFDRPDFTGNVISYFENLTFGLVLEKGIVKEVIYEKDENSLIIPSTNPIFLSKNTRLFSAFIDYMKLKKLLNLSDKNISEFSNEETEKVLSVYKLYDLLFLEAMLEKLNDYSPSEKLNKMLKENYDFDFSIKRVLINQDSCKIVFETKTSKFIFAENLSSGHQAILIMFLAQVLF